MNNKQLVEALADRLGLSKVLVAKVIGGAVAEIQARVAHGEKVTVSGLGHFEVQERPARIIRSVVDTRKLLVGPRHSVRFRAAAALRGAVAHLDDPSWADPAVQGAWRTAETLVGDLDLYHRAKAPAALAVDAEPQVVLEACSRAFGPLWRQVEQTFTERVAADARARTDLLAVAARRRWGAQA